MKKKPSVTSNEQAAEMLRLSSLITILPDGDVEAIPETTLIYYFKKNMPQECQDRYDISSKELKSITEMAPYFAKIEGRFGHRDQQRLKPKAN